MKSRSLLLMVLFFWSFGYARQQPLDESEWREICGNKDYTENVAKAKPPQINNEEVERTERTPEPTDDRMWLRIFLMSLAGAVMIFAIIFVISRTKRNAVVRAPRKEATSLEQAEENLPEVELNDLYTHALQAGQFKIAMRIRFLMVLQDLIDFDHITWRKQKTNRQYIAEILHERVRADFEQIVSVFDPHWYGIEELLQEEFEALVATMDDLKAALRDVG